MNLIIEQYEQIIQQIPLGVKLIAISKTKSVEQIKVLYDAGQRIFGESKVQELIAKQPLLPSDIEWHFVGHLQTNKVKYISPFIKLIHSVDSLKLLKEIDKQAKKNKLIIKTLLEFHIASENSKYGFNLNEAKHMLNNAEFKILENIKVCGVMGMATFTNDEEQIRNEFNQLYNIYEVLKKDFFVEDESFCEVSMGMTSDFKIAIECGSTAVRIGSALFT